MKNNLLLITLAIIAIAIISFTLRSSDRHFPPSCYGKLTQFYQGKRIAVTITMKLSTQDKTGKLNVVGDYQDENNLKSYISRQVQFNYEEKNKKLIATSESVATKSDDTMDNTWLSIFFADFLMRENRGIILDGYMTPDGSSVFLSDGIPVLYCNKA
ncbi:hypothetical protein [Hafnia paralvei]|jgi:hypothetical protein|uniref:hypothetical protein n=1 Tax=Hafnia paralvei TaxID=546367 RepID=UPI000FB1A5D1|nr:hypothetical protein [Hafnia paralvei]MCE9905628.1 hypothetical protein [Hafnia paralvei]MDX6842879.1 hypothetical protein [Hafnia paralvei]TBM05976.1 hypothetical protein EYY87_07745 [Hafnia paralvei]TBM29365.1 hypothetical protein EYY85_06940 [Hafnia paralvei]